MTAELKAGLFVLAAFAALIVMSSKLTQSRFSSHGVKRYQAIVKDATNLFEKTKIKMAGLDVGKLEAIELVGIQAKLTMAISSEVTIKKDAKLFIKSVGFLGDKYIEINPGSENAPLLEEGGIIEQGIAGGGLDELTAKTTEVIDNLKDITQILKQALKGADEEEDSRLDRILDNMENFTAGLSSIEKYGELADKLNEVAVNVRDITDKIKKGEGTIGKLLTDSETIDKLNGTLSGVNKLITKADRTTLIIDAKAGALTTTGGSKSNFSLTFQPTYDKFYLLGVSIGPRFRSSFTRKVVTTNPDGAGSNTVTTLEEEQTPNALTFNAQFGKRFGDTTLRIGLFETSGGVGVDHFVFKDRVKLTTEAYRFGGGGGSKSPQVNIGTEINVYKPFYVWAGGDDVVASNYRNVFIGVGLRFTDNDIKTIATLGATAATK